MKSYCRGSWHLRQRQLRRPGAKEEVKALWEEEGEVVEEERVPWPWHRVGVKASWVR
jgi:hypothetical protein